jgi:hypothetical protein
MMAKEYLAGTPPCTQAAQCWASAMTSGFFSSLPESTRGILHNPHILVLSGTCMLTFTWWSAVCRIHCSIRINSSSSIVLFAASPNRHSSSPAPPQQLTRFSSRTDQTSSDPISPSRPSTCSMGHRGRSACPLLWRRAVLPCHRAVSHRGCQVCGAV